MSMYHLTSWAYVIYWYKHKPNLQWNMHLLLLCREDSLWTGLINCEWGPEYHLDSEVSWQSCFLSYCWVASQSMLPSKSDEFWYQAEAELNFKEAPAISHIYVREKITTHISNQEKFLSSYSIFSALSVSKFVEEKKHRLVLAQLLANTRWVSFLQLCMLPTPGSDMLL